MRVRLLYVPALVAGLALGIAATPSAAQDTMQPQASFSQDQLESFATAAVRVDEIGRRWFPEIEAAPDEASENELRNQANDEMVEAVEAEGLTTEEYNQIFVAARNDPALRERIAQLVETVE